jgi:DNA-directed RNA polymerase subunit M/transcription elongation factor TFIIS
MSDEKKIAEGLKLLREGCSDIPISECPVCHSNEVAADEYEGGLGEVLYEICSCASCGAVWRYYYDIWGIQIVAGAKPSESRNDVSHN